MLGVFVSTVLCQEPPAVQRRVAAEVQTTNGDVVHACQSLTIRDMRFCAMGCPGAQVVDEQTDLGTKNVQSALMSSRRVI